MRCSPIRKSSLGSMNGNCTGIITRANGHHNDWNEFALLLIDIQNDFWCSSFIDDFKNFEDNIKELLVWARRVGLEVIHIREILSSDGSDWTPRYKIRNRAPVVKGTKGAEVLDCAKEIDGEKIFIKNST